MRPSSLLCALGVTGVTVLLTFPSLAGAGGRHGHGHGAVIVASRGSVVVAPRGSVVVVSPAHRPVFVGARMFVGPRVFVGGFGAPV